MALISEVAEKIYEIKPEGSGLVRFPLCTVYLVVDEKTALVEAGCPVQTPDILEAVGELGYDVMGLSYIIPTHVHPDHAGGSGLLSQRLPEAKVVVHQGAANLLSDPSMIARLMQGWKQIFGKDVEERFGVMLPVAEERLALVADGESIPLGKRDLKVIHTSGHDPYHLCFLDTITQGLFCGDAFGAHFSEIDVIAPPSTPGSDPILTLQSMEKLQELNPAILFFSHGGATREVAKLIELVENNARRGQDIVLKALRAGEGQKEIAHKLVDVLAKGSALARADLSVWPYLIPLGVEGYKQYFKKRNMI